MIKYFHQLNRSEYRKLIIKKVTHEQLKKDFPRPPWCGSEQALQGALMGCWPLLGHLVKGEDSDSCKKCKDYHPTPTGS